MIFVFHHCYYQKIIFFFTLSLHFMHIVTIEITSCCAYSGTHIMWFMAFKPQMGPPSEPHLEHSSPCPHCSHTGLLSFVRPALLLPAQGPWDMLLPHSLSLLPSSLPSAPIHSNESPVYVLLLLLFWGLTKLCPFPSEYFIRFVIS